MVYDAVSPVVSSFTYSFIRYLPNFVGGLTILAFGVVMSLVVKKLLTSMTGFFKFDLMASKSKIASRREVQLWQDIFIEFASWTVAILFLVPAAEVWGLPQVTVVLSRLILYLPNVFVAVIIGFIGTIFANLMADLVKHSLKSVGSASAAAMSALARYSIMFFTILIVLNQLGIAQDLIRILFTGIVAMLAIAGGLAFGLGGQDVAKQILEDFRKNLKN